MTWAQVGEIAGKIAKAVWDFCFKNPTRGLYSVIIGLGLWIWATPSVLTGQQVWNLGGLCGLTILGLVIYHKIRAAKKKTKELMGFGKGGKKK